ncbi:MAG: endonuclease/exonuclease/phosphatase family protein [Desulfobacterales bacterium]|jgi:endonuclease/exonuclease/phosphatase family metal-dependent hydrolase
MGRSGGSISVMTMNLRFGLADDGPDSWQFRKPRVAALFQDHRPDLIGFQEANGFQIDFLKEVLDGYGVIGRRAPAPEFWQNNVIFYRDALVCDRFDHFFLSHTPDVPSRFAESRWPRQCTAGIFSQGRRRVVVVNTHFDFDEAVQEKSAVLILSRLESFGKGLPTVLMGDFNAIPGSAAHRVLTGGAARRKQKAAFTPVFSPPYPGTHHDFSGASDGAHIDWILYRGGLVLRTREVCRAQPAGGYPSDHFPVRAEFSWPPGTEK